MWKLIKQTKLVIESTKGLLEHYVESGHVFINLETSNKDLYAQDKSLFQKIILNWVLLQ